jgi:hypothetical protein
MQQPELSEKKLRGAGYAEQVQLVRTRKTKLIGVHCTERMVSALERYIQEEHQEITRPEAIRQIMRTWLISAGYYK